MNILSIDPGHTQSAFTLYSLEAARPVHFGKLPNETMLSDLGLLAYEHLIIEQVACMGMAVGAEVFETVFWSGRFCQDCAARGRQWHRVKRHEVKMHLCGNMRAKDPNIRQALIDRYGGKDAAIGKKATPGPLYGVSADVWSALAVAVTWADTKAQILNTRCASSVG